MKISRISSNRISGSKPTRVDILGVGISTINMASALRLMERWIKNREQHYICVTGVHGIIESQKEEVLKQIHNQSGLTTPDGMPLVWLGRLAGYRHMQRVYGPDLMFAFCELAVSRGYRSFFYGGAKGVPEMLASKLMARFPGLNIVGTYSPPFRTLSKNEDDQIVDLINAAKPDVVWVGLSTPKQEHWMATHIGRVGAPILVGVGAAFDFHSGRVRQAPKWIQQTGLEWLFRLTQDPKRLWKRYAVNNPLFLWNLLLQKIGAKQFQ